MRKLLLITIILIVSWFIWQRSILPIEEIDLLKNCYISYELDKGHVQYRVTDEPPDSWVDIADLSATTVQSLLISEDPHFWGHNGIKYDKLLEAIFEAVFQGKKIRGHSSITQQFAKNYFLTPDRTLSRKIKEAVITWELENELTKLRLVELYINIVQFADGTYGLSDGACYYFDKPAADLTPIEAIYLCSLLPNPMVFSEGYRDGATTHRDKAAIDRVLKRLYKQKIISCEVYEEQLITPLVFH